jgi:hypothetical protein
MDIIDFDFDNVKFDAVWQRVTSDKCARHEPPVKHEPETGEAERLRGLMDGTAMCIALCRSIAARRRGRAARTLGGVIDGERRNMKKLRAMYFILTGGSYHPAEKYPQPQSVSEGLREIYAGAAEAKKQLFLAAADYADGGFADTYIQLASQKQRHAESAAALISLLF